jgi:hypothetical protein
MEWRSANSFSANPTANPVGAGKRKGWFVVFKSCDRLAPTHSILHPVLRVGGCTGRGFGRCVGWWRARRIRVRHLDDADLHHDVDHADVDPPDDQPVAVVGFFSDPVLSALSRIR